ncbi:hypothetical protein BAZ12_07800 [Elizabethkingia miricola]|uniref:DUF4846 domain-containing protein n=2 Tax=Weeksellaceae TaxID=2762318 RepID=A0ABD4DHQ8_ELIMR|nr:hypothetical protein ATB95_17330 [Elizabethkingia miricola]OPC40338.1 hypothetical protein BAX99_00270 [Elizabethkingia miricola]OPC69407.1 hypothetical protein BAZ13_12480 [Elizabethkingia miricola]OPC71945.1 hypothetical protein BAZ12_07800 [Elizabethkingia miricola]QCO46778.1 hypothetical protein FCS00_10470 [Elizabethkingia sp. 2-6]
MKSVIFDKMSSMKTVFLLGAFAILSSCQKNENLSAKVPAKNNSEIQKHYVDEKSNILKGRLLVPKGFAREITNENTWEHFIQNQALEKFGSPILKHDGTKILDQKHHVGTLTYDVGEKDLQQCADALIRLRAEYLFGQKRYNEIGFNFTSGDHFTWKSYAEGERPLINGNNVKFIKRAPENALGSYSDFRQYLDIIYNYAGTISLSKELKDSKGNMELNIGDLIITPGSPGHTVMIADKISDGKNKKYALIEGFTPAQTIHILSVNGNPWFSIKPGAIIETPRYTFQNAVIKRFE